MARILVIDDNDVMRTLIVGILESAGHEIDEASNGDDGLQKFRENGADLVITDLVMPGKEGIETIRELRQTSHALPIIAVSGAFTGSPIYLKAAATFGATITLQKPFALERLLIVVNECLEKGRPED